MVYVYCPLVTLSIFSLVSLDTEAIISYYSIIDFTILCCSNLNLCRTQHALRPYIDSETNPIRHFINCQFSVCQQWDRIQKFALQI